MLGRLCSRSLLNAAPFAVRRALCAEKLPPRPSSVTMAQKGVRYDGPVVRSGNVLQKACATEGCTKKAISPTDYCSAHGGGKRCVAEGCNKGAVGPTDYCIAHGGGKRCAADGCNKGAVGSTDYCSAHGGGKRCAADECNKGARGSTDYCTTHGGGTRCAVEGCNKSAVGSTDYCISHGGGKRCAIDGCTKSAIGSVDYCVAHGGGKRCAVEWCNKSAKGSTDYCIAHGGGKRCAVDGCNKGAQGPTDYCIVHGGGVRCSMQGCDKNGRVADRTSGELRYLCIAHAQDEGLLRRSVYGVSQEEMEFLHDVEEEFGPLDDRVRLDGTECVGRQKEGLVPGTRLRPDGYRARNQDGEPEVWFYHGWFWHGCPPEHPEHETAKFVGGKSGPDAYKKTMADMAKFQEAGMVVKYAWCFEYKQTRGRSPKERTALTV